MTEKQVLLVKYSWSYVADKRDEVALLFRKKLGLYIPALKTTLQSGADAMSVINSVHSLVSALPDLTKAKAHLIDLLRELQRAGISRGDEENSLITLLITLERKLGKRWTQEMKEAWVFVFATLRLSLTQKQHGTACTLLQTTASQ